MYLNNQAFYADISRYDWGIHNWGTKCEKVIDRLFFEGFLQDMHLGVYSAQIHSSVPSDSVERPVMGAAYYAGYTHCGGATGGAIARLKGAVLNG